MAVCPSCGTERRVTKGPCEKCGAPFVKLPDLELPAPPRPSTGKLPDLALPAPPRPSMEQRSRKPQQDVAIELAYDPRAPVVKDMAEPMSGLVGAIVGGAQPGTAGDLTGAGAPRSSLLPPEPNADAHLLADYGAAPGHWLLTPFYAWRVIVRRRKLQRARVARVQEATRAAAELEDALVAFGEGVRSTAEKQAAFAEILADLRRVEERLQSRDRVLAAENEAEMARLASADARTAKLEEELTQAQEAERDAAAELVAVQETLNREEASLRRTETELRAVREAAGPQE